MSCILITQNLFPRNSKSRNISLNANILIIFRNLRDRASIGYLARQVCPSASREFVDLFSNHIDKPYSYLLLDFSAGTPDIFRFRSDILSRSPSIYVCDVELKKCTNQKQFMLDESKSGLAVEFPEF